MDWLHLRRGGLLCVLQDSNQEHITGRQVSTELHPRLRKAGFISKIYLFILFLHGIEMSAHGHDLEMMAVS